MSIPQEQMKMAAMEMAIRYMNEHPTDEGDLFEMAKDIYEFFVSEAK